jgi:UDP-N-acetylmuramyl pentapeptide synthase
VNADDPVARAYAEGTEADVITFGLDVGADMRAEDVELGPDARAAFTLSSAGEREPVELAVPGEHMVSNALAAAAVGRWAGVTLAECATALKGAGVTRWRMETFTGASGIVVVNDAYNANPESMAAALKSARWMAKVGVWSRCSDTWPSSGRSRSRSTRAWGAGRPDRRRAADHRRG